MCARRRGGWASAGAGAFASAPPRRRAGVHFLDLSTRLNALVAELAQSSWVPLPKRLWRSQPQRMAGGAVRAPAQRPRVGGRRAAPKRSLLATPLVQVPAGNPSAGWRGHVGAGAATEAPSCVSHFGACFRMPSSLSPSSVSGWRLSRADHFHLCAIFPNGWKTASSQCEGCGVERLDIRTTCERVARHPNEPAYISSNVREHRALADPPPVSVCNTGETAIENGMLREFSEFALVTSIERQMGP